jgi:hypothetical protein
MDLYDDALQWIISKEAADLLTDIQTLPKPIVKYLPSTKSN